MKILQLTDLHIFADKTKTLREINHWQTWQAVLRDVETRYGLNSFDVIVLSGDLSHDESVESYQHIADSFADFQNKLIYLPGNHDDYALMQTVFDKSGFPNQREQVVDDWVIIGLNSQQIGKIPGKLNDFELQNLERTLTDHTDKQALIFLHHPVLKVDSLWADQIRLSNPHDLLALMAKHSNVQAVASGHAHQAFTKQHEDVSFYVTPSTCAQYKPRTKTSTLDELAPGYRIFEYAKGALQTKVCRIKL